jgi:hypothetical protein
MTYQNRRSKKPYYFPIFSRQPNKPPRKSRKHDQPQFYDIKKKRGKRLNTSRPDNASQREIGSTALSSTRFWRRDSFLRLERCPIRGSKADNRFAVKSNSVRLGGNSTESRSWSWLLVRSRTVEEGSSSTIGSSGSRISSSIGERSSEVVENGKVERGSAVLDCSRMYCGKMSSQRHHWIDMAA